MAINVMKHIVHKWGGGAISYQLMRVLDPPPIRRPNQDSIGHAETTQNHPEYVATALNQGGRVKNCVIIGVACMITDGSMLKPTRLPPSGQS